MSRKSRFSLVATLLIVSLTMAAPFNSLTLLAPAFTRTAAAINKSPLASSTTPDAATKTRIAENYGKLPLSFEANEGQFNNQARFVARGPGYNLALTSTAAVLSLRSADSRAVVQVQPLNANPNPVITGVDRQPGISNYFFGSDPTKWHTNVVRFAQVKYEQVYPGVDLVYYGSQRQLEYDFVVAPGADPNRIKLGFTGGDEIKLADNGDLVLIAKGRELRQHRPVIYQDVNGQRAPVAGRFVIEGGNRVKFDIGEYDRSKELVIDPAYFTPSYTFSTFLGGGASGAPSDDKGYAIALDSSGNAYVTGETSATNFPTTSFYQSDQTGVDAFVTKLNSAGTAVSYSTYLGGSGDDIARGIAVDSSGNAYVAGETSSPGVGAVNFPTLNGYQTTNQGGIDVFVTKLNSSGNGLVYSTYLGGSGNDQGYGLALDSSNNAYVTGDTRSTNFPATTSAYQTSIGGGTGATSDVFMAKVNPANSGSSSRVYVTYLGGSSNDTGRGIAVDSSSKAYVTGSTQSTNFPISASAWDNVKGGTQDAFVAKINPASGGSSDLVYSTYLGGSSRETAYGVAVDGSGNAFVTGETSSAGGSTISYTSASTTFPVTTATAIQTGNNGGTDVFVTKLNSTGTGISYSTLYGGSANETGFAITLDSSYIYVTGETASTGLSSLTGALQGTFQLGVDALVLKIDPTLSGSLGVVFGTYHGGSDTDSGRGIAVSSTNIYITGFTASLGDYSSTDTFPIRPNTGTVAYQTSNGGGFDAFAAKFSVP